MDKMNESVCRVLVNVKQDVESHLEDNQLISDGILDSLDIMNLIIELENEFDIEIDPADVVSENFESVAAIVSLVEKCKIGQE